MSLMPRESSEEAALQDALIFDLESLSKEECDLEFVVDHERVRAHRLIVQARCDRYRGKKRQWLAAADQAVVSVQLGKHHSPSAVRGVVKYLYTGQVGWT